MTTRPSVLAGQWYPGTESACRQTIGEMLGPPPGETGLGGVVPHAGWSYSGAIALRVWQALAAATPTPGLVLLFGTHMAPHSPPHISLASSFETPLGPIKAAQELSDELARELGLRADPADRSGGGGDNTVEVQLPLLKYLLPDAQLVVIGPPASSEAVELGRRAVQRARAVERPLAVVGSTDLTHYGPRFGFAPRGSGVQALSWVKEENDARMIERMLAFDAEGVLKEARTHHNACVPGAVAAALAGAQELGARRAQLLSSGTSADDEPGANFVGYAAVLLSR